MNFLELLWLIPLIPFVAAALLGLIGARLPKPVIATLAAGSILASFLLAAGAVLRLSDLPQRAYELRLYSWLPWAQADAGFLLDPLSSVMILVITGVGFLIHIYAAGYMAHETGPRHGGYYRFFAYLNLFVALMLVLVLANNYALLFVGWEGVGLASYLLIGFYFARKPASDAGIKAFLVNRIGDAGFILGMLLLFQICGSLRFQDVNAALAQKTAETATFGILSTAALLLFVGATGKSAQFPLYVWLPDAMEGPTPVSALIHAATMVTAGVYIVARSAALFSLTPEASAIVAGIGAFTAVFAGSIALVQNDIKRVLAYSTVSQLGLMFVAAGVGVYWVAIFHLLTHAFFKALLFLGAGSVIHATGEQDLRKMGGLKQKLPVTFWTMAIGALAISGIPGFAGFFSKDEILWQAWLGSGSIKLLWVFGMATGAMTAFYMWRLMFLVFWGESRAARPAHESPAIMTAPLIVLAAGSILAGWIGVPRVLAQGTVWQAFEHWLQPVFPPPAPAGSHAAEFFVIAASVAVSLAGIFFARHLYLRWKPAEPSTGGLRRALEHKWYVDAVYNYVFVRGLSKEGGAVLARFDSRFVDGGVNRAGWVTRVAGIVSMLWDQYVVDGLVNLAAWLVSVVSYPIRFLQSGFVHSYALMIVIGFLAILGFYWTRG